MPERCVYLLQRFARKDSRCDLLHGFRSDKQGEKALAVEALCAQHGNAFVRFDAFGHGQSPGDLLMGTIGRWAEDAVHVIDALTDGPQILWVLLSGGGFRCLPL